MQCKDRTDTIIRGKMLADSNKSEAFCDTTPPQIMLTSSTEAKGVNRDTFFDRLGALALTSIPNKTGSKTTRAVVSQRVHPDKRMVLPTNNLVRAGVRKAARTVLQAVNKTERATSAFAMRPGRRSKETKCKIEVRFGCTSSADLSFTQLTRLDAVPPGEHPTKQRPKNIAGPKSPLDERRKARPRKKADKGMIMNWQRTPAGTAARSLFKTFVKSSFSSVSPVAHMTLASIQVINDPRFVQRSVDGRKRPIIAAPKTKKGKPEVKLDSTVSIVVVVVVVELPSSTDAGEENFAVDLMVRLSAWLLLRTLFGAV
jgi:hypothetical protein